MSTELSWEAGAAEAPLDDSNHRGYSSTLFRVRRGSIFQLGLLGLSRPRSRPRSRCVFRGSPSRRARKPERIDFVYWFATVIAIFVFAVVAAILIYSVLKFRVKPDDDSDGPPIHGHTRLEIVWTMIPAVLVTAISIVSAIVLAKNSNAGTNPLVVKVIGRQFAWAVQVPERQDLRYLTLPEGRHAELEITSNDVIHSFWVPQFGQKQDAVPGQHNSLVVTPDAHRDVPGDLHRALRARPRADAQPRDVMTPADFDDVAARRGGAAAGGAPPGARGLPGERLRRLPHAQAGRRERQVGPDLDNLQQDGGEGEPRPLEAFIKESIVDPDAYIAPGYQPSVMPPTFGTADPAPTSSTSSCSIWRRTRKLR